MTDKEYHWYVFQIDNLQSRLRQCVFLCVCAFILIVEGVALSLLDRDWEAVIVCGVGLCIAEWNRRRTKRVGASAKEIAARLATYETSE